MIFFSIYKMINKTQRKTPNRSMWNILKSFQRIKNKRPKKIQKIYKNLTEDKKDKKLNKNLSEEQKQKLAEYRRNYYLTRNE